MTSEGRVVLRREAWFVVACAVVGAGVGAATQVLQGILPGDMNWAANSLSAWLVVAFFAAGRASHARSAAIGGVVLLLAALVAYEVVVEARFDTGWGPLVAFWAAGAVAGGLVFGPAGWAWRFGWGWARATGIALLASLLVAEAVYLGIVTARPGVAAALVAAGLAVPFLLGSTRQGRGRAYVMLVPCLALGAAGFAVMLVAYGSWTGS